MLVLKIMSVLLGLAFTIFGYFIYFRKKIISSMASRLISKRAVRMRTTQSASG